MRKEEGMAHMEKGRAGCYWERVEGTWGGRGWMSAVTLTVEGIGTEIGRWLTKRSVVLGHVYDVWMSSSVSGRELAGEV